MAEGIGANPTDRGRSGTKIHLHVDQEGIPLGVLVVGANVHDSRLVGLTIENNRDFISIFEVCADGHHLCLDKGYDYPRVYEEVYTYGLEPHIRSRGEEKVEKQEGLHPARRWVVERTFAWLKGFRGIRTRYCHYLSSFIAFVKLACALIVFRRIFEKQ
ncbi:MAG: IS5 family transposase [Desulfomonilaceae bacterium]